jgi:acetylornithine/succinyldiaminopimelate/putrescine aminotransferase
LRAPDSIAAILPETVPGTAGVLTPPHGYPAGVRAICDRDGIVQVMVHSAPLMGCHQDRHHQR